MSEMKLENISAENNSSLDAITCDIFDTLTKIFDIREALNVSLNQGYFHLAKTRYSMGVRSVSSLQYNLNEDSQARHKVKVDESEDQNGDVFPLKLIDNSKRCTADVLSSNEHSIVSSTGNHNRDKEDELCESLEKNLRLRKSDTTQTETEQSENDKFDGSTEKKLPNKNDPLLWFGVLVPQSLKKSQQHFVNSVHLSCELSGLQLRLLKLQESYKKALHEKSLLINDSVPAN